MQPIVLASTSSHRRTLLQRLGITFAVDSPDVDEVPLPGETPERLSARLAEAKARAVAPRHSDALVIGSDQVAALDDELLGKPGGFDRAVEQLMRAAGRRVTFHTGLCVLNTRNDTAQRDTVLFTVHFRALSRAQIEAYVRREQAYDCAGGFKSEGLGISLFEKLDGNDPSALVGLPLIRLTEMLAREGIDILLERN